MESTINLMIPFAIAAVDANKDKKFRDDKDTGKIKGIYESYLSQFGPLTIQVGIRSTLAVYQNKGGSSKGDRKIILDLIWKTISESPGINLSLPNITGENWVSTYLRQTEEIPAIDEQIILDTSVALKRGIRTFSLTDDKSDD